VINGRLTDKLMEIGVERKKIIIINQQSAIDK